MQRKEGLWIQGVNAMVPQRRVFCVYATKLASDESLGHQHMGAVYHRGRSMIVVAGELDCFSAHICLREPGKSEDKVDLVGLNYPKVKRRLKRRWTRRSTTVPQRRIYRLRRKGYRCKSTDSRAMGLAASWYRIGRTFVESSIPCSNGGRVLIVKGDEEVENAKANSKYQDRAKGQRPIRLMSMGFSSR
ncbi:hypothetical protein BHM03_00033784 [Ensete ventricosum]|nr:hypothetical protein BHM03_00033784 [Ensete ventricosum]